MDLSKIMAISGKPGLYKMLSQAKTGLIVESLANGKRIPVFPNERVSSLEEISIFSKEEEDIPLKEVFKKIYDKLNGKPGPDPKSQEAEIRKLFAEAVPEYDAERVYISDMKKAINWYNILLEKEMLDFTEEEPVKEEPSGDSEKAVEKETAKDAEPDEEKN